MSTKSVSMMDIPELTDSSVSEGSDDEAFCSSVTNEIESNETYGIPTNSITTGTSQIENQVVTETLENINNLNTKLKTEQEEEEKEPQTKHSAEKEDLQISKTNKPENNINTSPSNYKAEKEDLQIGKTNTPENNINTSPSKYKAEKEDLQISKTNKPENNINTSPSKYKSYSAFTLDLSDEQLKNLMEEDPEFFKNSKVFDSKIESSTSSEGKNKKSSAVSKQEPDVSEKRKNIKESLKEGSCALSEGRIPAAMHFFNLAYSEIKSHPEIYAFEASDIICLEYAYASACCQSGTKEDIKKAISIFNDIINNHSDIRFPVAYYGLGLCYYKLNRFKEALANFNTVSSIIEKGINCKVYCWPGTLNVIEETKSGKLKEILGELVSKCECPPPPDAICRAENCLMNHPPIYYTDPDFKGFVSIYCNEHCALQYHPSCWKTVKETLNRTDKEFLDNPCLTPDCLGHVLRVETIGKDAVPEKCFQVDDSEKIKRNTKQKKSKLEKKIELREMRKRKRTESTQQLNSENQETKSEDECASEVDRESSSSREVTPEVKAVENNTIDAKITVESEKTPVSNLSASAKPFYIWKKGEYKDDSKSIKPKERKKTEKKKATYSIDEFCEGIRNFSYYNEYQMRLHRLQESRRIVEEDEKVWSTICETECDRIPQLDPTRPFHIPEDLRNNPYALETVLQSYEAPTVSKTEKTIKENLYSYLEDVLSYKGPLHINDPELLKEISNFPPEAQQVIEKNGGFKNFILKSMRFATVGDHICVLSDMLKAYNLNRPNAPGQSYSAAIDALDDFSNVYDNKTNSSIYENHVTGVKNNNHLHLNPNAAAYSPTKNCDMSNSAYQTEKYKNNIENFSSSDKSLISVISEMRQPLSAWSDGLENGVLEDEEEHSNNQYNHDSISQNDSKFLSVNESTVQNVKVNSDPAPNIKYSQSYVQRPVSSQTAEQNMNLTSVINTDTTKVTTEKFSLEQIMQKMFVLSPIIAENLPHEKVGEILLNVIKLYLKKHSGSEAKSKINQHIKPYAIIEANKRSNKCIQAGVSLADMVSQGVMKEDDQLQQVNKDVNNLISKIASLEQQKKWLEEKLETALVKNMKLQNETHVEKTSLEKQLEELTSKYEAEKKQFKAKIKSYESDKKNWEQTNANLIKEEKTSKQQLSDLKAMVERYESQWKELQTKSEDMQAQIQTYRDAVTNFTSSNDILQKQIMINENRAKKAELEILNLKKNEFLQKINMQIDIGNKKVVELQEGLNKYKNVLLPWSVSCFEDLLNKMKNYIETLLTIRRSFLQSVEEQITEVTKGTQLSDLKAIEIPPLPLMPSIPVVPVPKPAAQPYSQNLTPDNEQRLFQDFSPLQPPQNLNPSLHNMWNSFPSFNQNIGNFPPYDKKALGQSTVINPFNVVPQPVGASGITNVPPAPGLSQIHFIPPKSITPVSTGTAKIQPPIESETVASSAMSQNIASNVTLKDVANKNTSDEKLYGSVSSKSGSMYSWEPLSSRSLVPTPQLSSISLQSKSRSASLSGDIEDGSCSESVKSFQSLPPTCLEAANSAKPAAVSSQASSGIVKKKGLNIESISASALDKNIELGYTMEKDSCSEANIALSKIKPKIAEMPATLPIPSQKCESKKSYDKLFEKLQVKYPQFSKTELMEYVKQFRQQRHNKLSGLTLDTIVAGVSSLISSKLQNQNKSRPISLINKPIAFDPPPPPRSTLPTEKTSVAPWAKALSNNNNNNNNSSQWSGESSDKSCIICYDEMTVKTAYKVDCGHKFHLKCIREWLNKTSNCPICRVHLLLPEDYPALN